MWKQMIYIVLHPLPLHISHLKGKKNSIQWRILTDTTLTIGSNLILSETGISIIYLQSNAPKRVHCLCVIPLKNE